MFIDAAQAAQLANVVVQRGDILLNITGDSVARCCQVDARILPARVNQHVAILRTKPDKLDARFLRYALVSPSMQSHLLALASSGATRNALTKGMIQNLEVDAPNLLNQKRIADILGSLDDKIELNRRMNQTLEAMAQAIFKSWFVDFEPVKAKAAAKASGASPEAINRAAMAAIAGKTEPELAQLSEAQQTSLAKTAKLFPDSFQDSELGEIPVGWGAVGFDRLATLDTTSIKPYETPDKLWEHYSIPSFDESRMPTFECGSAIKSNKYVVKPGAVLSSKLNPQFPRSWWPFLFDPSAAICSTEFMQFVSVNRQEQAFVYGLITSAPFQSGIAMRVTGSTGSRQRAQPKMIASMNVIDCGRELRSRFSDVADPIFDRVRVNLVESRTLAQIRDTLLPKLLSGDIRVSAVRPQTENALA